VVLDVWDFVVGHSDSMDRQMRVFQSLTTPGRIKLPSYYDNTKIARTFILHMLWKIELLRQRWRRKAKMPEKFLAKWCGTLIGPNLRS
jgi:hypothetical protein